MKIAHKKENQLKPYFPISIPWTHYISLPIDEDDGHEWRDDDRKEEEE